MKLRMIWLMAFVIVFCIGRANDVILEHALYGGVGWATLCLAVVLIVKKLIEGPTIKTTEPDNEK